MKRVFLIFAILALIASCKSQQCTMHDARCTVIRDTVMQHDSIYVHEFMQGDTVYVTKYRDRWRDKVVNRCDTVYLPQPSLPYEGKVGKGSRPSKFYKNCTWGFWILLLCLLGNVGFRILRIFVFRR